MNNYSDNNKCYQSKKESRECCVFIYEGGEKKTKKITQSLDSATENKLCYPFGTDQRQGGLFYCFLLL